MTQWVIEVLEGFVFDIDITVEVCLVAGVAVIMFPLDVEFSAEDLRLHLHQEARTAAPFDGPPQLGVEAHRLCLRVMRELFVESIDLAAAELSSSFDSRLVLQVAIHLVAILQKKKILLMTLTKSGNYI